MTQYEAFKAWWYNEGSQAPYTHHDCEEHTMRMCEIAWNKAQALAQPEQPSVPWSAALESVWGEPEQEPVVHDPLPRACNLAGVDYQTFLKIKAYMPVAPPQPERHKLQAKGEHPAPCARHCEANAFQIVIKNLKAQLAQPEQEPVAHCKVRPLRGDESFPKVEIDWVNQPIPGPLFTTPPQRKPLTNGEIYTAYITATNQMLRAQDERLAFAFARAIEAAHGIKEKQNGQ